MKPLGPGDPVRLGPYRLLGVLGSGGMGQVFLGRDGAGGVAAVKMLRPEFAHDQEMSRRFVREAHAARAVRGKGVARVLDARTEGGRPWIATEFLAGPTLEDAVPRFGPFAGPGLRALAASLARTLAEIHGAGLVHRDLKPANIVLTSAGPRVIDFGIARPETGMTLTSTGQVPVTPGYGAPEQVLGHRTTPAADVFSLGAVLVWAASGRRAFEGGHVAAVQYEVVHGQPRLEAVPPEVRELLLPCLEKDPGRRPAPGRIEAAFAPPRRADRAWREGPLAREIAEREEHARRLAAFPLDGAPAAPGRRRLLAWLSAGAVTAVAGLGAGAWWYLDHDGEDDAKADRPWAATPLAMPGSGDEPTPRPLWGPSAGVADGDADVRVLRVARDVVLVAGAGGGLAAHAVTDGARRWRHRDLAAGTNPLVAGGRLVLAADSSGGVHGVRPGDGHRLWRAADVGARQLLAADSAAVYVLTDDKRVRAVSLDERQVLWTVPAPVPLAADAPPAAAAGGGRLVLCGTDGAVAALDTRDGKEAWPARPKQRAKGITPALAGTTAYLGGRSLAAVALADGREKWSLPVTDTEWHGTDPVWSAPAVHGNAVYALNRTELQRVALADGAQEWSYSMPIVAPVPPDAPVVQGRGAWVALDREGGAGVVAVRTDRGSEVWRYASGPPAKELLAGADNRVFLLQRDALTALPVF